MKKRLLALVLVFVLLIPSQVSYAAPMAGVCATASAKLNIRQKASTSSKIVGKLSKGDYIQVTDKTGNFYRVSYKKGKTGYCSSEYLKIASSTYGSVRTESSPLNVRSKATTSSKVIEKLEKGSACPVLGQSGGFYRIVTHRKQGYVSKTYFKVQGKLAGNSVSAKILLNVPKYSQLDGRWANTPLGTKGKTIRNIGCLVCCLAMARSCRTGTSVYPDQMAKSMRFTPAGEAYWPAGIRFFYGGEYLPRIYEQIKKGNPVLVGATTASGSQHWVIVTGYTGDGKTLKTSDFTVNDPMSRTNTLAGHLQRYPYFYKMAYYE